MIIITKDSLQTHNNFIAQYDDSLLLLMQWNEAHCNTTRWLDGIGNSDAINDAQLGAAYKSGDQFKICLNNIK